MNKRKKAAIWVAALSIACGLIIWHAIYWHYTGVYLVMFERLQTGRSYITVLYNLGLMLVFGGLLGFLMEKITELVGYEIRETKNSNEERNRQSKDRGNSN